MVSQRAPANRGLFIGQPRKILVGPDEPEQVSLVDLGFRQGNVDDLARGVLLILVFTSSQTDEIHAVLFPQLKLEQGLAVETLRSAVLRQPKARGKFQLLGNLRSQQLECPTLGAFILRENDLVGTDASEDFTLSLSFGASTGYA